MATIELPGRSAADRATPAARALTRAAIAAGAAPSVFNTQPWRWRVIDDVVELRADRTRQLATTDPDGRLLTLSCGAALHHLRTALDGAGRAYEVVRWPDPAEPDLLARIQLTRRVPADPQAVRRQQAIALRRTDRRPFADVEVPDAAVAQLREAAATEGGHLHLLGADETITLAAVADQAAAIEFADPRYRAELATWTDRSADDADGVPADTAADRTPRTVRARDFAPGAPGSRSAAPADRYARYAVLFTDTDSPGAWLTAGEALSAVLITATMARLAVSPMSDVVEVPAARQRLRELLGGTGYPALALRIGVPESVVPPPPAPRRSATQTIEGAGR
jgi:hypothetical protein